MATSSLRIPVREMDVVFMSYGEPNAESNWADLLKKVPWAKRIKDIKGFDAVHRKAAETATTDWFVTVDADTVLYDEFLDVTVTIEQNKPRNFCWSSRNLVNGLCYGNGGLKVWHRPFAGAMAFHELGHMGDFCWDQDYKSYAEVYSDVVINGSALQAFRAGFREGVKLTMSQGKLVPPIHWIRMRPTNAAYLKIWTSLGLHADNGQWAICGARRGMKMACSRMLDQQLIGDFGYIDEQFNVIDEPLLAIAEDGDVINRLSPIKVTLFNREQSALIREIYDRSPYQRNPSRRNP